ncbi:tripartite tricarboxylate transporter TctB family protein [Albimonas sp. CAU 1670]|uniref:tripartite tricarboxylate transporter TctB family protein n=1 Tax=Albimonas sp. CAU 1670 TaxID=3032599 RepID=UPI0023DB53B9|nr:tripartite tricarboxylate transporter TctB family protein [Albimonas sp. CAU 1670]MDF2235737.1 tripartite tricarboxylate transporter TctB family protein [Albimonas sp. CAU 1670]
MTKYEPDHHDGTSDATPGGYETERRPGELVFALVMFFGSLALLWNAYGISGFEALSAPGTVPMATSLVMAVTAGMVALRTLRLPRAAAETFVRDILPWVVGVFVLFLLGYGILLVPFGFLPTSALFLVAAIKLLARRGWVWTLAVSLGSLLAIWLVFRIVFAVLMPAGVFPEAELIQMFRDLFASAPAGGTN